MFRMNSSYDILNYSTNAPTYNESDLIIITTYSPSVSSDDEITQMSSTSLPSLLPTEEPTIVTPTQSPTWDIPNIPNIITISPNIDATLPINDTNNTIINEILITNITTYPSISPTLSYEQTINTSSTNSSILIDYNNTDAPSIQPTDVPTELSDVVISQQPIINSTSIPTSQPTSSPTSTPSTKPSSSPTTIPTSHPTALPTNRPTSHPTAPPTSTPTSTPTTTPTNKPTLIPTTAVIIGASSQSLIHNGHEMSTQQFEAIIISSFIISAILAVVFYIWWRYAKSRQLARDLFVIQHDRYKSYTPGRVASGRFIEDDDDIGGGREEDEHTSMMSATSYHSFTPTRSSSNQHIQINTNITTNINTNLSMSMNSPYYTQNNALNSTFNTPQSKAQVSYIQVTPPIFSPIQHVDRLTYSPGYRNNTNNNNNNNNNQDVYSNKSEV